MKRRKLTSKDVHYHQTWPEAVSSVAGWIAVAAIVFALAQCTAREKEVNMEFCKGKATCIY